MSGRSVVDGARTEKAARTPRPGNSQLARLPTIEADVKALQRWIEADMTIPLSSLIGWRISVGGR